MLWPKKNTLSFGCQPHNHRRHASQQTNQGGRTPEIGTVVKIKDTRIQVQVDKHATGGTEQNGPSARAAALDDDKDLNAKMKGKMITRGKDR